jgi:hypothetical protein
MSSAMSIQANPERPFDEATKGTRVTLAEPLLRCHVTLVRRPGGLLPSPVSV